MSYALGITLSHKQKVLINGIPKEFEKLRELNLRLNTDKMKDVFGAHFDKIHSGLNLSSIEKGTIVLGVRVIASAEGSGTNILAITDIYYDARHLDLQTLDGFSPVRVTLDPNGPRERREKGVKPPKEIERQLGHAIRAQNLFANKSVYEEGIYNEEEPARHSQNRNGSTGNENNGSGTNGNGSNGKT